jgi:hypothetical protein
MNVWNRLQVREAILARMEAALAIADAEIAHAQTLETHMGTLVSRLARVQQSRQGEIAVEKLPSVQTSIKQRQPANDNMGVIHPLQDRPIFRHQWSGQRRLH